MTVCLKCKQEFKKPGRTNPKYCDRKCYAEHRWVERRGEATCKRHGCSEVVTYGKNRPRVYCSWDCRVKDKAAAWVTAICPWDGKVYRYKSTWPVKHCSRRCQRLAKQAEIEYLEQFPFHWRRKGHSFYGVSWPAARDAARTRDRVCQECGCTPEESGRALSVHHIRPFKNFGIAHHEEANALTNLTSLCHTCHASREHLQKTMPFFEQHG